jgi:acetylornithine deacetylase/succinyl-diaminopimelate desuccinylase-like protein
VEPQPDYLRMDASNPPGNKLDAVVLQKRTLLQGGILYPDILVAEFDPQHTSLVARLHGTGEAPPLGLLSHIDVDGADLAGWEHPPFSGHISPDGYLWGRGALEKKSMAAIEVMPFLLLHERGLPLKRDTMLVATGDEEIDDAGLKHLLQYHQEQLACSHVLNAANFGLRDLLFPDPTVLPNRVGEMSIVWEKLVAEGREGHGSVPREGEAPRLLAEAVQRIERYQSAMDFGPALIEFLRLVGEHQGGPEYQLLAAPENANAFFDRHLAPSHPTLRAIRNTTIHVTAFGLASIGTPGEDLHEATNNAVPPYAWAHLDCRPRPVTSIREVLEDLANIVPPEVQIGAQGCPRDDARFATLPRERFAVEDPDLPCYEASQSATDDPLYAAFARHLVLDMPHAVAVPAVLTAATESLFLGRQPQEAHAYRISPIAIAAEVRSGVHGREERTHQERNRRGLRVLYDILIEVAATPPTAGC